MLVGTIVVTGDGPCAHIDTLAQARVTHVTEMIDLRASPDLRILQLDEVANAHAIAQSRTGTDAGEGADTSTATNGCILDDTVLQYPGIRPQGAISQHGVRPDMDAVTQCDLAFDDDIHIKGDIATCPDGAAQIEARRVPDGHAGTHQPVCFPLLVDAFQLRQLRAVVDARHVPQVLRLSRPDRDPVMGGHGNHVGQVVFTLGVLIGKPRGPGGKARTFRHHDAGIHFAYAPFLGVRILVLDNAHHVSLGIPNDAAVSGGIFQLHREQREGTRVGKVRQFAERSHGGKRDVTVEDHDVIHSRHGIHRLYHGVTRSQLLFLKYPGDPRLIDGVDDGFTTVTVDDGDLVGIQREGLVDHVSQQRPISQRMQHLGQGGFHPGALPCSKDDDAKAHGKETSGVLWRNMFTVPRCQCRVGRSTGLIPGFRASSGTASRTSRIFTCTVMVLPARGWLPSTVSSSPSMRVT